MIDIVERLKEPEEHYPGNFDTPKRANAIMSCLCQEAAEEIESLRRQIAEKDAEIERLMKYRQDALDAVRNELVAIGLLPAERGWLAHEGRKDDLTLEAELMFMRESGYLHLLATREELAASQAREQQLREALQHCKLCVPHGQRQIVKYAIALPTDTTALQAMIAKAGEVMLERCCNVLFSYPKATEIAIRALPGVTLEDLK